MNEDEYPECSNCFRVIDNDCSHGFKMNIIFCDRCYDQITRGKIPIERVLFIKYEEQKLRDKHGM